MQLHCEDGDEVCAREVLIFLFPHDSHGNGSHSVILSPSVDMRRSWSRQLVLSLFLTGLLILFMAVKTLLTAALAAGSTAVRLMISNING